MAAREINEKQWQQLMQGRNFFGRNSAFFQECKNEWGSMNLLAIAGAADLVVNFGGGSVITDKPELRRRLRKAQIANHSDGFKLNEETEDEQGLIFKRSQVYDSIWNICFGTGSSFTLEQYMRAGAEVDAGLGAEKLCVMIERQLRGVGPKAEREDMLCCYRCGLAGHKANRCPVGGSWSRRQGRLQRHGGLPRCFVCARYTTEHSSENCPYRAVESFQPVNACWKCHMDFAGAECRSTCPRCNMPLRCWNCGISGHKLNECMQPRRASKESRDGQTARAPREAL
uniref:CCHC-type domain-containing protein n=1 Tax=Globodera rostochiensis TaxID=31243 RepID=A0A914I1Q2_GLORO